TIGVNTNGFR
ncbi:MAG: hypothetical protein EZS28_030357, partial [Streblomastix strix]